jgi:hypothetical protein
VSRQWLLFLALAFIAGLAAGLSVGRYALPRVPASIPAPKPSVREQIVGQWDATMDGKQVIIEFGPDETITFFDLEVKKADSFALRWFDDEHFGIRGKRSTWMRVVLRGDHLTLDNGTDPVVKCRRIAPREPRR